MFRVAEAQRRDSRNPSKGEQPQNKHLMLSHHALDNLNKLTFTFSLESFMGWWLMTEGSPDHQQRGKFESYWVRGVVSEGGLRDEGVVSDDLRNGSYIKNKIRK